MIGPVDLLEPVIFWPLILGGPLGPVVLIAATFGLTRHHYLGEKTEALAEQATEFEDEYCQLMNRAGEVKLADQKRITDLEAALAVAGGDVLPRRISRPVDGNPLDTRELAVWAEYAGEES